VGALRQLARKPLGANFRSPRRTEAPAYRVASGDPSVFRSFGRLSERSSRGPGRSEDPQRVLSAHSARARGRGGTLRTRRGSGSPPTPSWERARRMFTLVWVVLAIGVPAILTGVAWAHTGPSTPSPLIAAAMWTPLYAGFLWFIHEARNDAMAVAASEGRT